MMFLTRGSSMENAAPSSSSGRHFPRTNNATERLWLIYLADVCDYRMFKRRDFELNGITNANGNLRSCLLDTFQVSGNDMDWYGH